MFALVHKAHSPGGKSFELLPGLYVAHEATLIEDLIESEPASARLVAGLVVWQPGELRAEMKQAAELPVRFTISTTANRRQAP